LKTSVLLLAIVSLVAASPARPAEPRRSGSSSITPSVVEQMIERYGGRRAVDDLISRRTPDKNNDFGAFDIVLDGISSGDAAWLALVPKLDTGGHAAVGESLPIAVAYALPKNATGVLRLIALDRRWLVACGYPMIEPTREEESHYFAAAVPAVKSVRDRKLQQVKRKCLSELRRAEGTP
jgi:hypothetical protein